MSHINKCRGFVPLAALVLAVLTSAWLRQQDGPPPSEVWRHEPPPVEWEDPTLPPEHDITFDSAGDGDCLTYSTEANSFKWTPCDE